MARSNNQDRTAPPTGRRPQSGQPVDHGLPWSNAPQAPGGQAVAGPNGAGPNPASHYGAAGNPPYQLPQGQAGNGFAADPYGQSPYAPQQGYDGGQQAGGQLPWSQQGYGTPPYQQQAPQTQAPQTQAPTHQPQTQPGPGYGQQPYPGQSYSPQGYGADPQINQYLPGGYVQPPQQAQEPMPHLRGSYAHTEPGQAAPSSPDGAGYDFGTYMTPQSGYTGAPQGGQPGAGYPPQSNPALGRALAAPQQGYGYGQQAAGHYPVQPHMQTAVHAHPAQAGGHGGVQGEDTEEEYDEYEEEYDDEEPRRFGILKVVASLVVAIAIGGGAAYGYKMFGSKLLGGGSPVVLKADAMPAKLAAARVTQSGSQSSDSGDRVDRDTVPQIVPSGEDPNGNNPTGARKVQTIPITPSGEQPGAVPPIRPTISMPGLVVEGGPQGQGAGQPAQRMAPSAPQGQAGLPPRQAPTPVAPKLMAAADPTPPAQAPATPKRVATPKAGKANDAFTPSAGGPAPGQATATVATATTTAPVAAAPKAAGNGYVAVLLSSQSGAVEARKELDSIQSRYGDLLSGKPTDVTEAMVDGKQYYRGIVGPPGSRAAVAHLCGQLKAAGHADCFPAPY